MNRHLFEQAERLVTAVWRMHYRIPRAIYGLLLAGSLWGILIHAQNALPAGFQDYAETGLYVLVGVSVVGLVRWWIESRRKSRLVVPLFSASAVGDSRSLQDRILAHLRESLAGHDCVITPVNQVIGLHDRDLAAKVRRRLRANVLCFGNIGRSEDGATLHMRVVEAGPGGVWVPNFDTSELTFIRPSAKDVILRGTASSDTIDIEHPPRPLNELEVLLRGLEGELVLWTGDLPSAEALLREALATASSESQFTDQVRLSLATAVGLQGRTAEAIDILRKRAKDKSVDPEILRQLAMLQLPDRPSPATVRDSISILRRAAKRSDDPYRELSQMYLGLVLTQTSESDKEAHSLIHHLVRNARRFSHAWFLRKIDADWHFHAAGGLLDGKPDSAREEAQIATRLYRQAALSRRHLVLHRGRLRRIHLPTLLLYRNARLHYFYLGHKLRGKVYRYMANRNRRRLRRDAETAIAHSQWGEAADAARRMITGTNDDDDLHALVMLAFAERRLGNLAWAKHVLEQAKSVNREHAEQVYRRAEERSYPRRGAKVPPVIRQWEDMR
jgi:hypothetical protein